MTYAAISSSFVAVWSRDVIIARPGRAKEVSGGPPRAKHWLLRAKSPDMRAIRCQRAVRAGDLTLRGCQKLRCELARPFLGSASRTLCLLLTLWLMYMGVLSRDMQKRGIIEPSTPEIAERSSLSTLQLERGGSTAPRGGTSSFQARKLDKYHPREARKCVLESLGPLRTLKGRYQNRCCHGGGPNFVGRMPRYSRHGTRAPQHRGQITKGLRDARAWRGSGGNA